MKPVLSVILFASLTSTAVVALAAGSTPARPVRDPAASQSMDSRVEALLAMPAADRRAHLKSLNPEQRRGLWMQVKRAQFDRKGITPKGPDAYAEAKAREPKSPQFKASQRAVGTITYDSGAFSNSFGNGSIIGNRFDTHTGMPVVASGTVSTVVAVVVPGSGFTTSSAGFVLEGPQTGGGGAFAIFSSFTTATGSASTVTFSGIGANYTGSSFFVLFGDFSNSFIPAFGTGTTMGQGHHAVAGVTGGMGPNVTAINPIPGMNAFIRASGNLVPVELMKFDIS